MDRSQLERLVEQHGRPLANFLGLHKWEFGTRYEHLDAGYMMVAVSGEYKQATITFDAAQIDTEEKFLKGLAHELYHVLLWSIDLYHNLALARIGGDQVARRVDNEAFRHACEMQVSNMMPLWDWYLRDLYLEQATAP